MFVNNLETVDKEVSNLINEEFNRQKCNIELIASENFTSLAIRECLGSVLTNKYSEGRPNRRYYGGNEVIDKIELLCENRALEAFGLNSADWAVNVQPYSGSPANFAVYTGLLNPGDRIMGLDLPSGGHLSHGFETEKKKISATSIYFQSKPYKVNSDGWIDYDELETNATEFKPNILICGASAYPRDFDYKRLREIADKVGTYLMADIAHISGLVVTKQMNNPFEYCDIVTSTTHKTLRGPRSGMIFVKKQDGNDRKINEAVFPGLQGGPHNHQIAGLAVQLKEVQKEEFKEYIKKVIYNAQFLGEELKKLGFELSTDGTDNHLLLIKLKNFGITGSKMEKVCELVNISLNKNCVPGDKSALSPTGIRIGTPCMTTRGMDNEGWIKLAHWLKRCVDICVERQNRLGKKLRDWGKNIEEDISIKELREEIINYCKELNFYEN
jgi:glycine hydroxymethyltransferase